MWCPWALYLNYTPPKFVVDEGEWAGVAYLLAEEMVIIIILYYIIIIFIFVKLKFILE